MVYVYHYFNSPSCPRHFLKIRKERGKFSSTSSQLMTWSYWFSYEYTHTILCSVLFAIWLGRDGIIDNYGIILEEMLCNSGVLIDNTAVILPVLVKAHYTAKLFKQQGELHGAHGSVLLLTSLKNYWSQKEQSGKLSEPNGTLVEISGVRYTSKA